MIRKTVLTAVLLTLPAGVAFAESGFLTDYSVLEPQASESGTDLIYGAPGALERFANYNAVMVDQPEIHFSADSEYRGLKPEDAQSLAGIVRNDLTTTITQAGYAVVDTPGPNVLFLRTALSEMYLKKKKRGLLSYTPVGIVVHAGADALSETLKKVDIIEMTLEAELSDSVSAEVLGAVVLDRGQRKSKGHKEERISMEEFEAIVLEYSARFACRLDNARYPKEQRIDCYDPAAREARTKAGG